MSNILKNIGWIGTGVMGKSMCKHILNNNHSLQVFSRTLEKAQELKDMGAQVYNPQQIAKECDIIFLMLGYPQDVREVIFNDIYKDLRPGQIIVDHTTSSPVLAQELAETLEKEKGVVCIDAPVTGGDMGARAGKLTIMCGGPEKEVKQAFQIMDSYGAHLHHVGGAGLGQHTKIGNQIVIASYMIGVCEGLLYAHKAGLNESQFIEIIKNGSAASHSLINFGPKMVKGDFEPGFYVEHFVKDMDIALAECRKMNLALPGLALVRQFYEGLMAHGNGRMGTQALILVLEKLNGVSLRD